jgi:hypothetical protein
MKRRKEKEKKVVEWTQVDGVDNQVSEWMKILFKDAMFINA